MPRTEFNWRPFLEAFSQDLLADDGIRASVPYTVQRTGWMGFDGATTQQLSELEARLGKRLPPSYRAFLTTSNGWRQSGSFVYRLYSTDEVDWFRVRNRQWIDAFTLGGLATVLDPSVPDAEYFVYGDKQDPARGRWEYLEDALEISPEGDSAIFLLNPRVVSSDGEWEAWFFANWLTGATRYRSFEEMMLAERQSQVQFNSAQRRR